MIDRRSFGSVVARSGHLGAVFSFAMALALAPATATAATLPPKPAVTWIADAGAILLGQEMDEIGKVREAIERDFGVRVVVLTLADADGEDPKAIAVRALNEWNAGPNAVLLLVVMNPRKLFIQPGNAEAALFDEAHASAICRDVIAPLMKVGERGGGVRAGVLAIRSRLEQGGAAGSNAPRDSMVELASDRPESSHGPMLIAGGLAVLGIGGGLLVRRARARRCDRCQRAMWKSREVTLQPTAAYPGSGVVHFMCACGHQIDEPFVIPQLSLTTTSYSGSSDSSDSSDSSSSTGWLSSSSDSSSSWSDSSSSSSDSSSSWSDSSSSSSSDSSSGSGGGGSDW